MTFRPLDICVQQYLLSRIYEIISFPQKSHKFLLPFIYCASKKLHPRPKIEVHERR